MKKSLIALVLFVTALAFTGCTSDETDFMPVMEPSEQLLDNVKASGSGGEEEDEGENETETGNPGEGTTKS